MQVVEGAERDHVVGGAGEKVDLMLPTFDGGDLLRFHRWAFRHDGHWHKSKFVDDDSRQVGRLSAVKTRTLFRAVLVVCGFSLVQRAGAEVTTYTLPIPFRTSLEPAPLAGAPAEYGPGIFAFYPIDFNGDGQAEFTLVWEAAQFLDMGSTRLTNQMITTNFHEADWYYLPVPLPAGSILGPQVPGTGIRWGNGLDGVDHTGESRVVRGVENLSRYVMGNAIGGVPPSGYWSSVGSRQIPADWDFAGVRFELEDGIHYGYLHMGYEPGIAGQVLPTYAVLRGWAWETVPEQPILIVPEPWCGGLLMSGGLAALMRRRRQV